MRLDSVEIVVKIEKTFDINIPDQKIEQVVTVGDLHNCVWRHLSIANSDNCYSQSLYYKLRKSFADNYGFPKKDFTLDRSINEIFPSDNRRRRYIEFARINNLQLPTLTLDKPWSTILEYFGIAVIVGGLALSIILINLFEASKLTLLFPLGGIFLTVAFSKLLSSKRLLIEPQTVREFTQKVVYLNYPEHINNEGSNRKEMESVINHIIADISGLDISEVTAEKKICDDLGID